MSKVNSNQGGKEGRKRTSVIILILAILALVSVIVYLIMSREPTEKELRNEVITPDNVDEILEQMEEKDFVAPGYYTVTMNYEWHFATGDAISSDAYVENVIENTNAVYLDVFLANDEENAIYKSPVIPLGSRLQDIALDTKLDVGTYDCIAIYHLVDDEQNTISTLRVTITVIIEG